MFVRATIAVDAHHRSHGRCRLSGFPNGHARTGGGTWLVERRAVAPHIIAALRREAPLTMALPFGDTPGAREPRTLAILAKTIYRELRGSGYQTGDVIALAGELLAQVTTEVRAGSGDKRPNQNGASQSRKLAK